MITHDRRTGYRVPFEIFLNEYIQDRPYRALSTNLSETGIYLNKVISPILRPDRTVSLEFELPGTGDSIWARGQICYDALDDYFHGQGVRFVGMARSHARMLRDWCIEKRRAQLANLLDRIRRSRYH